MAKSHVRKTSPFVSFMVKRMVMLVAVMLIAFTINFIVPRLSPLNPIEGMVARMASISGHRESQQYIDELKRMFGLDKDLFTQYILYLKETLRGNLGYSIIYFPAKVEDLIMRALPWTLFLVGFASITSWILGSILGTIVGWKGTESKLSFLIPLALILSVMPYYMLALILVYFLAYLFHIFPVSGVYTIGATFTLTPSFVLDILYHSALPILSILLVSLGWWFLSMRSMIIMIKEEDFVKYAKAKGLSGKTILWKHCFRNALIPQVTGLSMSLGNIVGGSILTEIIFGYPGMGSLLYQAVTAGDYPLIQGIVLLLIVSVSIAVYIIDVIYPLIDPRIKYGRE